MKIIILSALFSVLIFAQVEGFQQCKGENMNMDDSFKNSMKTCATKYKIEQGKKPDPCFMPCIYSEMGSVADGKMDLEKFKAIVSKKYPTAAQNEMNEGAKKCISENSETLSMDDSCKSWGTLTKCLWQNHMTVCKGSNKDSEADME